MAGFFPLAKLLYSGQIYVVSAPFGCLALTVPVEFELMLKASRRGKLSRSLRVVMVTGAYFPEISGAGLQCRSLIRAASNQKLTFSVITTCTDKSLPFRDRVDGIAVYRLHVPRKGVSFATVLSWVPRLAYLSFKELARADIIHLHGLSRKSYFFITFGRLFKKILLLKMTSLGVDDPAGVKNAGFLQVWFWKSVDYYLAPSRALAQSYRSSGFKPERLFYLCNGVDTIRFHPAESSQKRALRSSLALPQDEVLVLC